MVWLIGTILKEEVFTKPVPPNIDYRQAVIDSYKYNLRGKEVDRRMTNGYYVKIKNIEMNEKKY